MRNTVNAVRVFGKGTGIGRRPTSTESNHSIPGVLKNAIDWASRPYGDNAWDGKPVAVMGASPSMLGTARAQYHLRQCFVFLNMYPMNGPEVMIAKAPERFNPQGELTDENSRKLVRQMLEGLAQWTLRLGQKESVHEHPALPRAS